MFLKDHVTLKIGVNDTENSRGMNYILNHYKIENCYFKLFN